MTSGAGVPHPFDCAQGRLCWQGLAPQPLPYPFELLIAILTYASYLSEGGYDVPLLTPIDKASFLTEAPRGFIIIPSKTTPPAGEAGLLRMV